MKVLFFTRAFSPHDQRFLEALAGTGHEIHYLPLLSGSPTSVSDQLPFNVRRYEPLAEVSAFHWYRYPAVLNRLKADINRIKPDLIHAGPIHLGAALTAMTGFKPLVSMSWGSDLLWETRKPWIKLAARYALQRSDSMVADCQAVKQAAVRLGMDEGRIVVFPWGTDLERFNVGSAENLRREFGWEDNFVLLSTRSFEPLYGVDLIIQAFIQLAPQEPALRLLLLGDGSQRQLYKQRLRAVGLDERVRFAGLVPRQDLPEYYRVADLYLSASYSDGSSVSLLEAMATGLPALVSDTPGNREWVEPGVSGWWFQAGEVDSLAAGIKQAVEERDRFGGMGVAARGIVEKRADWVANFPRLLDAYQIALDRHGGQTL